MYPSLQNQGITSFLTSDNVGKNMVFTAKDAAGNATTLSFVARPLPIMMLPPSKTFNYLLPCAKESLVKLNGDEGAFYFPQTAFYENVFANIYTSNTEGGCFSPIFHIHNPLTPVHSSIDIAIKPTNLPEELRPKAFIAHCQSNDGRTYTVVEDGQ
jgi:hypothetical protein